MDHQGMRDTIEALHITGELAYEEGQKILYLHWWYQAFVIRLDRGNNVGPDDNDDEPPLSGELPSTSE